MKPQYVGCAGRVTNAINFVNATYSTARGHTLIASRLWVPEQHLASPATRDMMGIPGDLQPATKPQLGAQMLAEALDAGTEVGWAAADEMSTARTPGCGNCAKNAASVTCSGWPARSW